MPAACKTMRFDAVFRAAVTGRQLTFADHDLREPDRLARDRRHRPQRRARRQELRARDEPLRRAPCLPAEPAPLAARHAKRDRRVHAGELGGAGSSDRGHAGARAPKRGLRVTDPARRPLARRDPALAPDRRLLGRSPRPHAGAREGARRRLPGRDQGQAAARVPARRDRDGDAHRRRLRPRADHAPAVAVHRPRPALPLADAGLGAARRRRRSVGARQRLRGTGWGAGGDHHHHGHDHGTSTLTTTATGTATPTTITTTTTSR